LQPVLNNGLLGLGSISIGDSWKAKIEELPTPNQINFWNKI